MHAVSKHIYIKGIVDSKTLYLHSSEYLLLYSAEERNKLIQVWNNLRDFLGELSL